MDINALAVEMLLKSEINNLEELFLQFIVMEPFIRQLRASGVSNKELIRLCREIDEERNG